MSAAEQRDWSQLGDVEALDRLAGFDGRGGPEAANDSYAEFDARQQQGGGSWPFDAVIAENAMIFIGVGFSVAAKKRGPHWAVEQDDARRLGVAIAQVVHRYMPDFDNVGPVGNLCIVGATMIGPRLMLDAMQGGQRKQQDKKGGEGEQSNQ